MIGKINPAGASFKSAVEYNIRARDTQERKDNSVVLCSNMGTLNSKELIEDFQEQSRLNTKIKKPVFHTFLSFHKDDSGRLDKEFLLKIVVDYLFRVAVSVPWICKNLSPYNRVHSQMKSPF